MKKLLFVLLVCTGCATTHVSNKPVVGKSYLFYNSYGLEPGVVKCDTIKITEIENYCIHFTDGKYSYIMDERKFRNRMRVLK